MKKTWSKKSRDTVPLSPPCCFSSLCLIPEAYSEVSTYLERQRARQHLWHCSHHLISVSGLPCQELKNHLPIEHEELNTTFNLVLREEAQRGLWIIWNLIDLYTVCRSKEILLQTLYVLGSSYLQQISQNQFASCGGQALIRPKNENIVTIFLPSLVLTFLWFNLS